MEEAERFGARLKELRRQAGLNQRELANKVGIDFTYLSKIENGVLPPPSERVILQLAEVLNTDKDELIILAGRIPSDLGRLFTKRGTLRVLRSIQQGQKMLTASNKKRRSLQMSGKNFFKEYGNPKKYGKLSKVAVAAVLVLAVAVSLWSAAPVLALEITISDPSPKTLGSDIKFDVTASVEDRDYLPIKSVDLYIENKADSTKKVTCEDLPLTITTTEYSSAQTGGGGEVSISATTATGWGYGYGYRYGYGYETTEGWGYYYFGYGYGYGYVSGAGATSITYSVTWSSPASWPEGAYEIKVNVNANDYTFVKTRTVTFTEPVVRVGVPRDTTPPVFSNMVASNITRTSAIISWTTDERSDSQVEYWTSPSKFTPLDETLVYKHLVHLTDLTAATTYHYKTISRDAADNLAVSDEYTFTTLKVEVPPAPAAFTVSDLTITPAEVDIGETVTISVLVTNTGDLSGSYEVTLKIDNIVVATEEVTVAGGASKKVTFTTSQDIAETYAVNVNGQLGTFKVKVKVVPPVIPPPINWWLIGGIIAGCIIIGVVIWLVVRRRKA